MACQQVLETPCKINLHLGIHHEKDARGYHRVDSLMVPVALADTITIEDAPALTVRHEPALELPAERTTVWRAATQLAHELGREPALCINVRSRIPERAGLGGSSADAGAVLRLLCQRWGIAPEDPRVLAVARGVGADVPFFLSPRPGLYLGAGDVLARGFAALELPLALVMPTAGISTKEAYDEFDRSGEDPASYEAICAALEAKDAEEVAAHLFNNLAAAACRLCADVWAVREWLRSRPGVRAAQVSGSGACSFALCESAEAAERIASEARERHGWRAWATHTLA